VRAKPDQFRLLAEESELVKWKLTGETRHL
jgi:hypothetical protein